MVRILAFGSLRLWKFDRATGIPNNSQPDPFEERPKKPMLPRVRTLRDGCAIVTDLLPEGDYRGYDTPKSNTLIHEIENWFGLDHAFVAKDKCDGESDTAKDTLRFPMDEEYIFKTEQPVCCLTDGKWYFCPLTLYTMPSG